MNICRCFTAYCGYVAWHGIILIIRVWTFIIAHISVSSQCTCLVRGVPVQLREGVDQGLPSAPATHQCVPGHPARLHGSRDAIMATCSTAGCRGKPRGGEIECDKCKHNVVDLINRDNIIINELLMYANQHRRAALKDSIIQVLASHFTSEEINEGKTLLVTIYGEFILPDRKKNRKDSQNMSWENKGLSGFHWLFIWYWWTCWRDLSGIVFVEITEGSLWKCNRLKTSWEGSRNRG